MAIAPISWPQARIDSTMDFSPLAKIGELIKQGMDEREAAQLISQLYDRGGAQQAPMPQQQQQQPARVAPPAAPPPRNLTRELTPPPLLQPNERVAQGHEQFGGAPAVAQPNQPSSLDTAQWPAGPQGAPMALVNANQPSPLDTEQWPAGPQGAPVATAAAPAAPMAFAPDIDRYARSTSIQESGSPQGDYRAVGPPTKKGERALGRYQVLTSNIPSWTEKYFGQRLTPTEFLNNPTAQDAVYRGKFGELAQKYGPEGAARAWFAGEGGMNNPNASDGYTTVRAYADKFNRNLPPEITAGQSQPPAEEPTQAMALDQVQQRAIQNLSSQQPAQAAGIGREEIAALYKNPLTRPIATAFLQKQLDPGTYKFIQAGDNLLRYNERTGEYSMIKGGKLHTVGEDQKLIDSEGRVIYGGGGSDQYGKLPAGERWKDPNNKALGTVPIAGSKHGGIGDELAPRIGLAKSFISTLPQIRQRIDRGDVGIENTANHAKAIANFGDPGETKRMIDAGAESLIRMLTGAGMSASEATENAKQYRVAPRDTAAVVKAKVDGLERHLFHIGEVLGQGRGGINLLEAPAAPDRAAIEAELRKRGALK